LFLKSIPKSVIKFTLYTIGDFRYKIFDPVLNFRITSQIQHLIYISYNQLNNNHLTLINKIFLLTPIPLY